MNPFGRIPRLSGLRKSYRWDIKLKRLLSHLILPSYRSVVVEAVAVPYMDRTPSQGMDAEILNPTALLFEVPLLSMRNPH